MPWDLDNQSFDDPRLHALSYAILAPNPHNQQPWQIELVGSDGIILHPDTSRFLPETDPPNRQITIGYGAFLELLTQAASANGYEAQIEPFPEGTAEDKLDARPIASVRLVPADAPVDDLFSTIRQRRTNRKPFNIERPVPQGVMAQIKAAVGTDIKLDWTNESQRVSKITEINKRAWAAEMSASAAHAESTRLTRIGAAEVNAQPDGISLHGPVIEGIALTGIFSREGMDEKGSFAFNQTADFYSGLIEATPTYAWLITPFNDRLAQLQAGRAWARLNQTASALGVAFHPISQALQEFAEMAVPFRDIHEELGVDLPARVQGIFRLGYADAPPPAPRWPLKEKLLANG